MKIDQHLSPLKKITQVETPDHLFAQIKLQIYQSTKKLEAPMQWKVIFAAAALVIVSLNVMAFLSINTTKENTAVQQMAEVMQLSTSNNLYNE